MFLKNEIQRLNELYDKIQDVNLESFLDEDDLETIHTEANFLKNKNKDKLTKPMAYLNLKNRIITPRDLNRHCTITVQRLHSDYKFYEWFENVMEAVTLTERTEINIGFSFISWKPHTNERTYLYSAKALSSFKFIVDTREELLSQSSELRTMTDAQLLDKTFLSNSDDNPFSSSGFCPLKIVSSYIYITK